MSLADDAIAFLARLEAIEPGDLDQAELDRLRALRNRVGWMSNVRAEEEALDVSTTTEFEEPTSRTAAERAIKVALSDRRWRGKVLRAAAGGWTVTAKSYTRSGTVIVYASTVEDALSLVEALDPAVEPLRGQGA